MGRGKKGSGVAVKRCQQERLTRYAQDSHEVGTIGHRHGQVNWLNKDLDMKMQG